MIARGDLAVEYGNQRLAKVRLAELFQPSDHPSTAKAASSAN